MSKKNTELFCVLDRFENSKAVLRFNFSKEDTQEINVAKRYLPSDVSEGDIIYIELYSDKKKGERRRNLARLVLEEILQN